jgi:peroxin-1
MFVLLISFLFAVLHPWLRQDLGAALLWDHVVVRPCATPKLVVLEGVTFHRVRSEHYNATTRPWLRIEQHRQDNLPDRLVIGPLTFNTQISVGSLIVLPDDSGLGTPRQYCRVVLKDSTQDGSPRMIIATEDWKDRSQIAKEIKVGPFSGEVIVIPSTDRALTTANIPISACALKALVPFLNAFRRGDHFIGILHGSIGTGKTHVVKVLGAVAGADHGRTMLYLDCKRLQQHTKTLKDILAELDDLFQRAATTRSCLIVLDDLDRIAPNLVGGNEGDPGSRAQGASPIAVDQSKVVADRILQLHAATKLTQSSVSIVATCASDTALHLSLCNDDIAVSIGTPDFNDRFTLFSHFLFSDKYSTTNTSGLSASNFGQPTEGFRPRDMEKLAARTRRSIELTGKELNPNTVQSAFIDALQGYTQMSHIGLEKPRSKLGVSWPEIGGLFAVKTRLEAILLNPVKYRAIYEEARIRLPRGILLHGPTGCGKSSIVPALAEACKFPLISCKGPEVLDKYIGASEAKIRELFQRAASVAPSILFLDEMDSLAPRRGSDHTGVTDRVVNQLLTFLDGVEDTSGATVYVIGASSRPDKIDPALLRPGRLEQHLYVGPPATDLEWVDLVRKTVFGWKLSISCHEFIMSETGIRDLLALVKKQQLLCPADLKAAMDTAQLNAVHRTLRDRQPEDVDQIEIEVEDLRPAFVSMRPCLSPDDARMLESVYDRYRPREDKRPPRVSQEQLKTTLR